MRRKYIDKTFSDEKLDRIAVANSILDTYSDMGLTMTLRQLYYQFVSHHGLPNNVQNYKALGKLISDARLAGLLDWDAIEDRGRVADKPSQWSSINVLIERAVRAFRLDRWRGQDYYVELWVEKQALAGVLEPVARENHITLMVNKGYSSQSAMYESAQRFLEHPDQEPLLLYLGDHDPSGEDMVRDVGDRLRMFGVHELTFSNVKKIALTMDQVEEFNPPPNPAKITDSRAKAYIEKYGDESWEVDALDPQTLVDFIQKAIDKVVNKKKMKAVIAEEEAERANVCRKLGLTLR